MERSGIEDLNTLAGQLKENCEDPEEVFARAEQLRLCCEAIMGVAAIHERLEKKIAMESHTVIIGQQEIKAATPGSERCGSRAEGPEHRCSWTSAGHVCPTNSRVLGSYQGTNETGQSFTNTIFLTTYPGTEEASPEDAEGASEESSEEGDTSGEDLNETEGP